jgi:diguanylate cyclase
VVTNGPPLRRAVLPAVGGLVFLVTSCVLVTVSPTTSYAVRAMTALAATVALLVTARRRDELSRARVLLAGGLLIWSVAGIVAALDAGLTDATEPGDLQDWVQMCAIPLAVAGLLAAPGRSVALVRTIADGAVAAGSLWFITLEFGFTTGHTGAVLPTASRLTAVVYLLLPIIAISVLLSVAPRALPWTRPFFIVAAAAVAALSLSDMTFAMTTWSGTYLPTGRIAVLDQIGLGLFLIVALLPLEAGRAPSPGRARREPRGGARDEALPYVPLVVALAVLAAQWARGATISHTQTLPVLLIGSAFVVRHAAIVREHGRLVASLERSERAARDEALHDPLTGLPNRTAFIAGLRAALDDPASHPVAVALLDLNDFKEVNDTHGHETGDRLLIGCAERLRTITPASGLVARLGGDEFALFQPRADRAGAWLVESVTAAFAAPIAVDQRGFAVRPSIGVVIDERPPGRTSGGDAGPLLAHADVAMYQAKASKDRQSVPAVVLIGEARSRAEALIRMRDEISDPDLSQFHVAYQPVVRLRDGQIVGAEALLRWRHPVLGPVNPTEFIPLAEQIGSMNLLGDHVMSTAVADLARWRLLVPDRSITVGVNLSPLQLTDTDLPARALQLLRVHGQAPDRLVLEITEGALMDDLDAAVGLVEELRAAGLSVAVDDFGTGYSSLRYLRRFPVDVVKIDREFVQAAADEPRTAALVESVVDMARALDLETVAEGIETVEQLRACQALGAAVGQGYLFSPAVDSQVMADLLVSGLRYTVCHPGDATAPVLPYDALIATV